MTVEQAVQRRAVITASSDDPPDDRWANLDIRTGGIIDGKGKPIRGSDVAVL